MSPIFVWPSPKIRKGGPGGGVPEICLMTACLHIKAYSIKANVRILICNSLD